MAENVFEEFLENYSNEEMGILCNAYKNLSMDKSIALRALSIKSTNCIESVSFTNASVVVDEHLDNWYPIGMVFVTGLKILQRYLENGIVPESDKQRDVLATLLKYLLDKEITSTLSHVSDYKTQSKVMLLLLNHLLLRVTPNSNCCIDKEISWIFRCPDECKYGLQNLDLETSDTSIGHQEVWHGTVDALIGRPPDIDLAISVLDPDEREPGSSGFGAEVKQYFFNADKPHHKTLSEAIVFSFLQKRTNPSVKSLIPTIGISATELVVYFYDYEKDVLLQSRGIPFIEKGEMQITAILVAWLVVNFKCLCDGLTESLNDAPKAKFSLHCKDKADIYKSHVRHGLVGKGEAYSFNQRAFERATLETPNCLAELTDIIPMKRQKKS